MIVYPRNEQDVRKIARFTWQLAERGKPLPMTVRGSGTDQSGAAIGEGLIIVMPAHMNKILMLDPKKGLVVVQPGAEYGKIQQTLHTHGRFLPPYPASLDYSTIGGAVGNNSAGEKSIKYGATREFVKRLRVVLANGEVIETGRLSKRELNKKKGLTSFEGEVYRQLDGLITDNWDLIQNSKLPVSKNAAGYELASVKQKDGSFDLTPLLVGSQGTLGVVTEIELETDVYNPNTTLIAAYFDDSSSLAQAVAELAQLRPSAMEVVDDNLLNFLEEHNPNQIRGLVDKPFPHLILLVEFDDLSDRNQKRARKKAAKTLKKFATQHKIEIDEEAKERMWKIRRSTAAVIWQMVGNSKALPVIDDGTVPLERLSEFLEGANMLFDRHRLTAAIWGHAGDGNLHINPFFDLSQVGDRQKVFKVMEEYYNLVLSLGGTTTGEHNDGRLRGPYLPNLYGPDMYEVFRRVKQVFDPYNTLNPGVKIDVTLADIKPLLRHEYSVSHLYDHMPRT
jgi:FAD/FMN-containing dehydrogenase